MANEIDTGATPVRKTRVGLWIAVLAIIGALVLLPAVLHAVFALVGIVIALVLGLVGAVVAAGAVVVGLVLVGLPLILLVGIGILIGRRSRRA